MFQMKLAITWNRPQLARDFILQKFKFNVSQPPPLGRFDIDINDTMRKRLHESKSNFCVFYFRKCVQFKTRFGSGIMPVISSRTSSSSHHSNANLPLIISYYDLGLNPCLRVAWLQLSVTPE